MRRFTVQRRNVLQATVGGVALAALPGPTRLAAQGLTPVTLVVILIEGDGGASASDNRDAVAAAFATRGLPIGLARTAAAPRQDPGAGDQADPTLWHDGSISQPRYFQARALSEARAALAPRLGGAAPPAALASPDPGGALALAGLAPAGLRCAYLMPDETAPAWIESHPSRVVASRGGHVARVGTGGKTAAALEAAQRYIWDAVGDPEQTHAALFVDLAGPSKAVTTLAAAIATDIAEQRSLGQLVPLAPTELGVRHAQGFGRLVALRLDPPPGAPADDPALAGLADALTAAGIAYSVTRDDPTALGPVDCPRLTPEAALSDGVPAALRGWYGAVVAPADERAAAVLADAGIKAGCGATTTGYRGLDGHGLLHLGREIAASRAEEIDALPTRLGLCEDVVLAIDTGTLALPVRRHALMAALRRLASLPGTRIVDLAEFARLIGASDAIAATMRRTRAMAPAIAARAPAPPDPASRALLMADAQRAWSFFEQATYEKTGMPDATIAFAPDGKPAIRHEMLTHWDVGSAIFGWIAALRLGLVDRTRFDAWREKLLVSLAATTLPSPRLPRAIFYASNPGRGAADFNVCDSARLLTALRALDKLSPEQDTGLRDLVANWQIADMVIDGVPHSLARGTPRPAPDSHCTSYIKRAFALWGITTRSFYDAYHDGPTETDGTMRLLDVVADIGTLGAEPLLQEALEFGFDAPDRVLRDVLLAEQITRWRATGELTAPSEGPMDRPPWFTYQGLRIDRDGPGRWDVISLVPGGGASTAAFRTEARMVTAKAPFLWAATHPHGYCDKLVAYVRQHGQMRSGFVSGIYSATDTPTLNYGDINTNGVILEAIAAILGDPIRP